MVKYVNLAFCTLLGRTGEELLNLPYAEAVKEGSDNQFVAVLDRVLNTGSPEPLLEQAHRLSDFTAPSFWSYTAWPVRDAHGTVAGVMFQVIDSTETARFRKQVMEMNGELLRAGLRQQELNVRLQRSMRETHHRIKNNLQVVVALAELQVKSDELGLPPVLNRIVSHVRTLASLHDLLTQRIEQDLDDDTVPAHAMLHRVLELLERTAPGRKMQFDIAQVMLSTNQCASLALLVSELVSNAINHGGANISVALRHENNTARMSITDDGRGFPPGFDASRAAHTGLDLVMSLARHDLRGSVEFSNGTTGGAQVEVTFPMPPQG